MTINPALADRLASELRHRGERHRESLARLHDVFELGPLPEAPPVELADLSAEALAEFTGRCLVAAFCRGTTGAGSAAIGRGIRGSQRQDGGSLMRQIWTEVWGIFADA